MNITRRGFLKNAAGVSLLTVMPGGLALAGAPSALPKDWRSYEVTTRLEVTATEGATRAWIPLPGFAATDWIRPQGDHWTIEGGVAQRLITGPYGTTLLAAEWPTGTARPIIEVTSRVATHDRQVNWEKPGSVRPLSAAERQLFLAPTKLLPTDGLVKAKSDEITAGARTDVEKARRIYDWIVVATVRDPKTKGCGVGDISHMLKSGTLGGKCADLNGLFVGLARAAGLPARDLYGIRVGPSDFGYKSLGTSSQVISKAQHCRAEVYLEHFGWVPVDPADVRKVMLEEPPGNLPLEEAKVATARAMLFGGWESNWIAYNQAHDVVLPGARGPAVGYLMYPEIETDQGYLDSRDPDACKYVITTKSLEA